MRIRFTALPVALAMAALALPVAGQSTSRATRTTINSTQQTPYTAEFKVSSERTLTNGSTITHEQTEVQAVDSQGRRMTAFTTVTPEGVERTTTSVTDPVAGTHTNWDTLRHEATVMSLHPQAQASCASSVASSPATPPTPPAQHRTSTTEDLGVETIDGVEAHGRRITTTTPAGMVGNSEPLVSTREFWQTTSIRPALVVRETSDDPERGKSSRELTNLSLSEPDPSVFQPPQGYEVVKRESGPGQCPVVLKAAPSAEPNQ
jgi:hypothetical protein